MDDSQYVVCFNAKSTLNLLNQRGSVRGRGHWRGRSRTNFVRGGRIGRGGGRGRGGGYVRWNGRGGGAWRYNRGGGSRGYRGERRYNHDRGNWSVSENEMWKRETEEGNTNDNENGSKLKHKENEKESAENVDECAKLDNLYVLGDSFGLRLCKAINSNVKGKFKLCRGGLKIDELKECLCLSDVSCFKDEKVLIFIGMNDLQKDKEQDLDGMMYSLVCKLLKMGLQQLYICTLPTLPNNLNSCISSFNEIIHQLSVIDERICVIDLELVFVKEDDTIDESCYEKSHYNDKFDIHPNVDGFKKIYELIKSYL